MRRMVAASRRWLVFGVAALAAAGLTSAAFAQSSPSHIAAPMTPIATAPATSTRPPTPVQLTPSASAGMPSASSTAAQPAPGNTSPTPNAPPTGSGWAFGGRPSDAWFFGGSIVAMLAIALVGGWLSVGRRR